MHLNSKRLIFLTARLPILLALGSSLLSCKESPSSFRSWVSDLRVDTPRYEDSLSYIDWPIKDYAISSGDTMLFDGPLIIEGKSGILVTHYKPSNGWISRYEWYAGGADLWRNVIIIPANYEDSFGPASANDFRKLTLYLQRVYGSAGKQVDSRTVTWTERNSTLTYCDSLRMIKLTVGVPFSACANTLPIQRIDSTEILFDWKLPQTHAEYLKQWSAAGRSIIDTGLFMSFKDNKWGVQGQQIASYDEQGKMRKIGWSADNVDVDKYFEILRDLLKKLGRDTVHEGSSVYWRNSQREYRLKCLPTGEFLFARNR